MTGANDEHKDHVFGQKPGIEGQTDAAEAKLKELGYQHVSRVQLQAGHSALHAEVWKFIDEVLEEETSRIAVLLPWTSEALLLQPARLRPGYQHQPQMRNQPVFGHEAVAIRH